VIEALYGDLAEIWPLLTPPGAGAEEATAFAAWLEQAAEGPVRTLLELGCGSGHLAAGLPEGWELCLVDRAPRMLALAGEQVPRATLVEADLRSLALGRRFDAVLLHDAVMYLASEADLQVAFTVAFAHLRPGGAFLVVPDLCADDFEEHSVAGGGELGGRAAQLLEWHWDPDPADSWYQVDFAVLLREVDGRVRCVHEQHRLGLHRAATYARCLRRAGFSLVEPDPRLDLDLPVLFLARRPRSAAEPPAPPRSPGSGPRARRGRST